MVENDKSWLQEDSSWRKTTFHDSRRIPLRNASAFVNHRRYGYGGQETSAGQVGAAGNSWGKGFFGL
jgi:hypothetical protein